MTVSSQYSASVRPAKLGPDINARLVIPSVFLTGLLILLLVRSMMVPHAVHLFAAKELALLGVTLLSAAVVTACIAWRARHLTRAKVMFRALAGLRAPALAMATQMLPVAPEDIVLIGLAMQVWFRDARNPAGRSRHAWRGGAAMLAAMTALPIVTQPQRLAAGLALAEQVESRAGWDHQPLNAAGSQEG